MILVAGSAGFIGSNFVLDWLAQGEEPILCLDKLACAGKLEDLASLQGEARHMFVQGDLGDRVGGCPAGPAPSLRRAAFGRRKPRRSLIHGAKDFIRANIVGTFRLLESVRG